MTYSETVRKDAEHLRLLSVFYYVMAALTGFFALFFLIYAFIGGALAVGGAASGGDDGPPMMFFGSIFAIFGLGLVALQLASAGLLYFTGRSLVERRRYIFCMVIAGLNCLSFPMGTALGIFTFIVLARPSVKALFESGGADPLRLEVDGLFRAVADSGAEAGAGALLRLAELYRAGERATVAYYAFRPTGSGTVLGHRWGCRVLARAVPNMIEMMTGPLAAPAEELLRAVQGRSPLGSGRESWQAWWSETGRALFENAGAAGDDVIRPCPPECPPCRACERRGPSAAR